MPTAVERMEAVREEMDRLRAELDDVSAHAQEVLNRAEAEDRDLTPDEQTLWDSSMAKLEAIQGRLAELDAQRDALVASVVDERAAELRPQYGTFAYGIASGRVRVVDDSTVWNGGVRFDKAGRVVGSVFDSQFDKDARHMANQANVISHKLSLNCFKGKEEDAFYCGHWLRALIGRAQNNIAEDSERYVKQRGWGIRATATEGNNAGGGYTVPDPLTAAFIEERKRVSVAMQVADVRSMTSDTLSIPRLTSGPTVQYPGEASSISATDQVWGQIALTAIKRAILEKISNELLADSVIDLAEQVASRMAYQFALQMDNEFINGDGTATYGGEQGLLDALGSAGVYFAGGASNSGKDTWAEIVIDDLTGTMGKLTSEYRTNRAWVMSTAFYFEVALKLVASAGGNTIASVAGGMSDDRPMLLGYPVYITDWMPTSTGTGQKSALFGAFSQGVVIGDRQPLQVAVSTDRYFEEDVTAMRGVSRYDINVFNPGDSNTAGAYVALSTSST